jgi:hypothetical protein
LLLFFARVGSFAGHNATDIQLSFTISACGQKLLLVFLRYSGEDSVSLLIIDVFV